MRKLATVLLTLILLLVTSAQTPYPEPAIPPPPPQYTYYLPLISKPPRPMANIPRLGYQIEGGVDGQAEWLVNGLIARVRVRWDEIETAQGVFDWSALDATVLTLRSYNHALLLGVIGTPEFYRMDAGKPCSPPTEANSYRLAYFARLLAQRYHAEAVELWNEPDISAEASHAAGLCGLLGGFGLERAEYYGRLVAEVGNEYRTYNLSTWLVAGSLALQDTRFWEIAMPAARGMYDALSYHSYTTYPNPYYGNAGDKAADLRAMGEHGFLILSEFALLSAEDSYDFRNAQAEYLAYNIYMLPAWDVISAIWYPLAQNDWMNSDLVEHGVPQPAWYIMQAEGEGE
jgi:hypothetical protein